MSSLRLDSPDVPVVRPDRHRADLFTGLGAVALVLLAGVLGYWLTERGVTVDAHTAPLLGEWWPHAGPGTPFAVALAVAVVAWGPALAARLRWPTLLAVSYLGAVGWTFALSMVDGWQRGFAGRLTTSGEYLHEVPGVTDIGVMLRRFSSRILDFQPDSWVTHVSGHPPGALLVFVWLDRIGLGGGAWAALTCALVGASATVAVAVTVRALRGRPDRATGEAAARAVLPFAVLFPGAVWIGVSADGLFAGVAAWGITLLAVGAARSVPVSSTGTPNVRKASMPALSAGKASMAVLSAGKASMPALSAGKASMAALNVGKASMPVLSAGKASMPARLCAAGGVLLGFCLYLSYGLVLLGVPAVAAVWLGARGSVRATVRAVLAGAVGVAVPVLAFTVAGFWWLDGYHLVVQRYYQGIGADRPYAYWVWADLACLALAAGPAAAVVLRRSVRAGTAAPPAALLMLAVVGAVLLADLSGLSKAEVERIWLPFSVWLTAAAALLPFAQRRYWLVSQAVTALAVNHVVLTSW